MGSEPASSGATSERSASAAKARLSSLSLTGVSRRTLSTPIVTSCRAELSAGLVRWAPSSGLLVSGVLSSGLVTMIGFIGEADMTSFVSIGAPLEGVFAFILGVPLVCRRAAIGDPSSPFAARPRFRNVIRELG